MSLTDNLFVYAVVNQEGIILRESNGRLWVTTDYVVANRWNNNLLDSYQVIAFKMLKQEEDKRFS